MKKSIGIVGAGAAGLCAAKHMMEAGYAVTLYEIGSHVGGMWVYKNDNNLSSAYRTLHINTARDLTAFKDYPFDKSVQPFPDHKDMASYLVAYAKHYRITERIRFKTRVVDVRPAPDYTAERPRWQFEIEGGGVEEFDAVIVAKRGNVNSQTLTCV